MDFDDDTQKQDDTPTPRMLSWARNSVIYRISRKMHTEKQLFDAVSKKAREKFDGSGLQVKALAEAAVTFAYEIGGLNDTDYAEVSTQSGTRGGKSKRAIARKLSMKGVASDIVEAAVADIDDLGAAVIFARKRAFGPFRRVTLDEHRKAKELSAFARAGFGFDIGKTVFEMPLADAEEALAGTRQF